MSFLQILRTAPCVLFDGAMGTELMARGAASGGEVNLKAPELVRDIHQAYADAGARVIVSNTLTVNPVAMEGHYALHQWRSMIAAGVMLARDAAGPGRFVVGDIGPIGRLLEPHGPLSAAAAEQGYMQQADALAEEGVDGFLVETMYHLDEALLALRACKRVSGLPVIVSFALKTSQDGGRTVMGDCAADCALKVRDAGGDAVGLNCGELTPLEMAGIIEFMAHTVTLPLMAQPNAGRPRFDRGKPVYDMTPGEFAEGLDACRRAGARLIGGCCGTTPAHIRRADRTLWV